MLIVEAEINCPSCYEPLTVMVDTSQGSHSTVEDCQVCCRPMEIVVECEPGDVISIEAYAA